MGRLMKKIRLAEVMAALAMATGLGMGQSIDWTLRGCLLSVRFTVAAKLDSADLRDVYYLSLLHYIGCTTDAHQAATFFGNDLTLMRHFAIHHMGDVMPESLASSPLPTPQQTPPENWQRESSFMRCDVAVKLAQWCGLWENIQTGLWQFFERWNGEGLPNGLQGAEILTPVQIVQIAQDAETFYRIGGIDAAISVVKGRAGSGYDPALADFFCQHADEFFSSLEVTSLRQAILDAEPLPYQRLSPTQFDRTLEAIADFVDIKSPFTTGHSRGVANLAVATAQKFDLSAESMTLLRRAALVHDLGQVSIPTSISDKTTPLTESEQESVRLHPYFTERVFSYSKHLRPIGALAALHHEHLDGSGYHRGLPATIQPLAARILTVAEAYQSMSEPRPYRPELSPKSISERLQAEVSSGKFDGDVVAALLSAVGVPISRRSQQRTDGLSKREVEVLRLIARGASNRQMAETLGISVKTVGHHVQHIYDKLSISNRAAATLYAMQNDFLYDAI